MRIDPSKQEYKIALTHITKFTFGKFFFVFVFLIQGERGNDIWQVINTYLFRKRVTTLKKNPRSKTIRNLRGQNDDGSVSPIMNGRRRKFRGWL